MHEDEFYAQEDDEEVNENVFSGFDQDANKYSEFSLDTPDLDETPFPVYMQQLFPNQGKQEAIDHGDDEGRGNWDSQFEYLLSTIGYAVGLGNIWRFPGKVYYGGGGAFLLPYLSFCIIFGMPMLMVEIGLGQFSSQSCTKAFHCVPFLFGQGWTMFISCVFFMITYTIVIAWCFLYFFLSFQNVLPWTVCSNSYNTPFCVNVTSTFTLNNTNASYESSSVQFWNFYVTGQKRRDGSYYLITESLGSPVLPTAMCVAVVLVFAAVVLMFGIKVSGKVIYITVIFPYIAIIQFIILGCTLPGALKGIKFYLYPDPKKLIDPMVILSALEQLLFSSGIGVGGLITLASFNRFRDPIYRNVWIVVLTDFTTSFVSGFATFPVLGYMSYRSGKEIKDLLPADSGLFFITYPEALSTMSNSNLWTILFMLMAIMLGVDSLFVLMETVIVGISDFFPFFHTQRNRLMLTILICFMTLCVAIVLVTPGGMNWLNLYDFRITPFVLPFSAIIEMLTVTWVYGLKQCLEDFEMMTLKRLNFHLVAFVCVIVPLAMTVVMVFGGLNAKALVLHGNTFPEWTQILAWVTIILSISPIPLGMTFILIKYRIKHPELSIQEYLKECIVPPPTWGPKLKRYWVTSDSYARKLIKYKKDPRFKASLAKSENLDKLVYKAERKLNL